jgi:hypothetical protein
VRRLLLEANVGWGPEPVSTLRTEGKSLPPARIKFRFLRRPIRSLVTLPTVLLLKECGAVTALRSW